MQNKLIQFAQNQMAIGGIIGDIIEAELTEMAIQDQFTGLENRLVRDLRQAQEKPYKIETVFRPNDLDDELSGDYYNDKALFYRDGSVEVVSYKGEGEHFFDTVEDYKEWVNSPKWRFGMYDEDDYYGDED